MIAGLKPYPKYKDSGIPFLDRIPDSWQLKPLKRWVRVNARELSEATPEYYEFRYLDIGSVATGHLCTPPEKIRFRDAPSRARRIVRLGDSIISTVRTYLKAVYFIAGDASDLICSTGFAVLTPKKETVPKFVSYLIQSDVFTERVSSESVGIAYPAISESRLTSFQVAVPSSREQAAIVRFLDHADRKIRRYIRAKQKLIKLLEEQKQAVIHRAVARGLDPNVRLKRSGVEWLGDVPEHWEIRRNGRIFTQRNQTGFAELPILEVSLNTGVRIRDFEESVRKQVMSDRAKYKRAAKGDIAYNMMRMWQGAVGVAPVDGLVSPAYVVAKPLAATDSRYYSYLFRTAGYMNEVDKYSRGIVKDRNRLYWEDFKRIPSPCPPPEEQIRIADAIESSSTKVDEGIAQTGRGVELVREFLTRLIADVVTGKLDIREAAAKLPDEVPEPEPAEEIEPPAEGTDAEEPVPEEAEV